MRSEERPSGYHLRGADTAGASLYIRCMSMLFAKRKIQSREEARGSSTVVPYGFWGGVTAIHARLRSEVVAAVSRNSEAVLERA